MLYAQQPLEYFLQSLVQVVGSSGNKALPDSRSWLSCSLRASKIPYRLFGV